MPDERILIVDDDPFVRDLVRQKLGLLGYKVFHARDGREAVERTYEHRPHLIVLDMNMPDMNGFETLCHLKADADLSTIPVLMLTASRTEKDVRGAMKLGASGYLTKPFKLDQLSDRIRNILKSRTFPSSSPSKVQMLS